MHGDLPDAWFQCVYRLIETGREYVIDRGSFAGQKRLEFNYVTIQIRYPGVRPLIPDIPPALGIPNPGGRWVSGGVPSLPHDIGPATGRGIIPMVSTWSRRSPRSSACTGKMGLGPTRPT